MRFAAASLFLAGCLSLAVSAEVTWRDIEERGRAFVKQHARQIAGYSHLAEDEMHLMNALTDALPLGSVLQLNEGRMQLDRGRNVAVTEGAVLFDVTEKKSGGNYTAKLFSVGDTSVVRAATAVWRIFKERNVGAVLSERFGSAETVLDRGFLIPVAGGSLGNNSPVIRADGKWSDTAFLSAVLLYPRVAQTLDALLWSGAKLEKEAKFFLIRRLIQILGDLHRSKLCHGNLHPDSVVVLAETGDIALTSFGDSCFRPVYVLSNATGFGGVQQDAIRLGNIAYAIYNGKYDPDELDECNDNPVFLGADDTDVNDVAVRGAIMRLLCCGECTMGKPADYGADSPLFSS
uniref:Protein kinase (Incomplete catalytic triad),putative n=1 Tax=Neospora caninum (strain Liverpool) TaxID=572307 RepID=A0A0F7UCH3_NEOCL|nr:TPA: protein kinase (incomplete catalytic triad),putative [Neospora caninum Liverpool]